MLKSIFTLFYLFFSISLLAQKKCKFDVEHIDKITNKVTRAITVKQPYKIISLVQTADDAFNFGVSFGVSGQRRERIKEGDTLFVKLEEGTLLKLICSTVVEPVAQVEENGVTTYFTASYLVTKDHLIDLKRSPIVYLRVQVGETAYDLEYKPKQTSKIQKGAECMSSM